MLADRERDSHDDARGARRSSQGEEVAHWAARVTERTRQQLGQQLRTSSRIDRSITAAAGERAGTEHARARRLPFLLEGGLRTSASLELVVVDSAKHAHHCQSRRESFTASALERSAQRTSTIQRASSSLAAWRLINHLLTEADEGSDIPSPAPAHRCASTHAAGVSSFGA